MRSAAGADQVNYYEHHLGDYAAATAHLSWDEDMAYTRLLRAYYHHEKPLPLEVKELYRLVRASNSAQRKAVDGVLREFFVQHQDGWHQKRCDEEIARYQEKRAKAQRSADARWHTKRTDSDGNASASGEGMRTHSERIDDTDANALRTQCEGNAPSLQSPIPISNPISRVGERTRGARLPDDWILTPERRAIADAEHVDADRTFSKFTDHWRASSGANARKRDWDAAWRNWCRTESERKPLNGNSSGGNGKHVTKYERTRIEAPEVDEHGNKIPF